MNNNLGLSGKIANFFLVSELTPLLALVGLLMGAFAVLVTPREEEPQINVTFANVHVAFPGASSNEVEQLVSIPAEQVLSEIQGVKHVYSISQPGLSTLTVQFKVGEDRTQAIVRLYNAVFSNQDWLPENLGIAQPLIKPMGIDDVPIVAVALWSESDQVTGFDLQQVAHTLEVELKRIKGTRDIYSIGAVDRVVHIVPDIEKLASYNITLLELKQALRSANLTSDPVSIINNNENISLKLGSFFSNANDVGQLVVAVNNNAPVYLKDVADVKLSPDQPEQFVTMGIGPASSHQNLKAGSHFPTITIAVAKKAGENAVDISQEIIKRLDDLKGTHIPDNMHASVIRNYGKTANDKAQKLISKLAFATISVVLLVFFTLGRKEAVIVGASVIITLTITLFASWAYGFTINRVSLFALIFSIGILVDDAIVVVENIHRHISQGNKTLLEAIPLAVDEVGGPTILATFTVIAALLPMAFVSGLMGPYMSPIPINASMGMLISLAVAFIITPWMANKLMPAGHSTAAPSAVDTHLLRFFETYMKPFLRGKEGSSKRWMLLGVVLFLIAVSVSLPVFKAVVLKMLPFDNKSEFQIVLDMPEGTPVEITQQTLKEVSTYLDTVPEVTNYQIYAGTAAPINFNGLVRQYYLRRLAHAGDIQVNLLDKSERSRKSHEIAASVREPVRQIVARYNGDVKIVEVPPGPPVLSPIVAEIYGPDYEGQRRVANELRKVFESTTDITDVDDSVETPARQVLLDIDYNKAALFGISKQTIVSTLEMATKGEDVTYLHGDHVKYPTPLRIEISEGNKSELSSVLSLKVRNNRGDAIAVSEFATLREGVRDKAIYHKDLLHFTYVSADLAGKLDSPLYGMFDIAGQLENKKFETDRPLEQFFINQPGNPYDYSIKWDGEWQITYETFRDMGIAYAVGIILIYLLVVAQFRSYIIPLIIMAPIPLTIIGVMPGHAIFNVIMGSQFTATSMIGMIALAGIIVRNSILLVDFVNEQLKAGVELQEAVIRSGAVRAKPIILTGLAAMLGALFILDDPIFNGLAISLIFGVMISTILTLFIIPILYYSYCNYVSNK
ncbi:efflux RND transporter permease subunit [Kaarinaea lacus]